MSPHRDVDVPTLSDESASEAVQFHEETGMHRTEFDVHGRPASDAVVAAVSAAAGDDPLDLPPLYTVLDPDALDALFASSGRGSAPRGVTVSFEFADCRVRVNGHGTVVVDPAGGDRTD